MRILPFIAAAVLAAVPVSAHEFWISPQTYIIDSQDQLLADIRVGENFKGGASSYIPRQFKRFDLVMKGATTPVTGKVGDRPALNMPAMGDGLVTVVYQTGDSTLTYSALQKFINFTTHKDFAWAVDEHKARGLPDKGFKELYSRYGKSLIAVGDGTGRDQEVGLLTEIVALANPYTDDLTGGMPVQVLYDGAPRGDVQVELFERDPEGEVLVTLHRTDAAGKAVIPVKPGHEYLVDAVVMRALYPEDPKAPVWESLWASLTFLVPAE